MRSAVFLVLLLSTFQTTHAQESLARDISQPYLEKLIEICKTNYPKVKMYEDRINIAENGVKRAKKSYFDIFSFSYLYSPTNNTTPLAATSFGGYQFGFFANIGSFLQKPVQVKQAKGEYMSAVHDKESFDLNIEAEVKKRYFTYVQKLAVLRIRSASLLDVESLMTGVKHRFENGEETLDNYNKMLLILSEHNQNIINSETEVMIAKSSLEELLGKKLEDIK